MRVSSNPHMDAATFERLGDATLRWITNYLDRAETLPVASTVEPGSVRRAFPISPPEHGGSIEDLLDVVDELRAAGVEVSQYNPIAPWRLRFKPERLTRRNHRKMLVVDGRVGLTGGVNIGDQWLPTEEGGEG